MDRDFIKKQIRFYKNLKENALIFDEGLFIPYEKLPPMTESQKDTLTNQSNIYLTF